MKLVVVTNVTTPYGGMPNGLLSLPDEQADELVEHGWAAYVTEELPAAALDAAIYTPPSSSAVEAEVGEDDDAEIAALIAADEAAVVKAGGANAEAKK